MTNPFEKTENWVETGPDGHHFYVRKKEPSGLPSFKAIFREAAHDLWHASSPFWKEFKKANKKRSKSNPAIRPQIPISTLPYPYTTSQIGLNPPIMQAQQDTSNNKNQTRGILKPEPHRFPSGPNGGPPLSGWTPMPQPQPQPQPPSQPFPAFYPGMMQSYGGYTPQMGYNYNTAPIQNTIQSHLSNLNLPPGPTQPPGGFQGPALPPGARAISPPRFPTRDDLKYKCAVCGRFRSARYHYRHPLVPGQLPGTTVCRKCRNTATDSEEESIGSEDSLRSNRYVPREIPRGRRALSRSARSRGRSQSRARSFSRSNSYDDIRPTRTRSVRVRRRSPRRVVYVEADDPDYLSGHEDEEVEVRTIRRIPRSATPGLRRSRSQYSDSGLTSAHFRNEIKPFEERTPHGRNLGPRPRYHRQGSYHRYSSDMEQNWYAPDPPSPASRSASRHRGGSHHYRRPSATCYPESDDEQAALIYEGDDARSAGSSRPLRGRSPRQDAFAQRIRENVQPVEQQSSSDDYDWYDREGMRVRVREI